MRDQGLDASERQGEPGQPHPLDEAAARRTATCQLAGDHAAPAGEDRAGRGVRGVSGKPRPVHGPHGRVPGEPFGDHLGVGAVLAHPQRQRRQPPECQPGGERVCGRTQFDRAPPHPAVQPLVREDGDTAQDVGVTGQILGGRVHDDVGPVLDRAAQHGRGEGVVHQAEDTAPAGGRREHGEVRHLPGRVGDRLQKQQTRLGPHQRLHVSGVTPGQILDLDPEPPGQIGQHRVGPAVQAALGQNMIAGLQQGQQHPAERAHPGREGDGGRATLKSGDRALQRPDGGVAAPRVDVLAVRASHGVRQRVGRAEAEGRRLDDGHTQRPTPFPEGFVHDVHGACPYVHSRSPARWCRMRCRGAVRGAVAIRRGAARCPRRDIGRPLCPPLLYLPPGGMYQAQRNILPASRREQGSHAGSRRVR